MKKTNKFTVKKIKEENITVEEERKYHSAFLLFLRKNGKLIFTISLLFSMASSLIAVSLTLSNVKESTKVEYESNGVIVSFSSTNKTILNGLPITSEYANKVFTNNFNNINITEGVVIKIKEVKFKGGTISFYSDKTALVKYNDGTFMRVSKVEDSYGISESGTIDSKATTKALIGELKENENLGISILYLSDGTAEVTKGNSVFFIRNTNIINNDNQLYSKISGVSIVVNEEKDKIYYSDGTIKVNNKIIVDNIEYALTEKKITNGIEIIYYENGYAEVKKGNNSIMVKESNHIVYDENILEIIYQDKEDKLETENIMDLKNIILSNTNKNKVKYMIVLEETEDYSKHNVTKRLDNEYINFNVYANGNQINNNILNNNIKGTKLEGDLNIKNDTYLLYEGQLDSKEEINIKLGLWISYETITNEYMNSAFIGTIKVYIENLD